MEHVAWTRHQQTVTLNVIPVIRAVLSSDDPGQNVAWGLREMEHLVPGGSE